MRIESVKDVQIGEIIFGYPWGNNRNRSLGDNQNLVEFEVVGVGRKYLELSSGPYGYCDKYNIQGVTQRKAASGYTGNGGYYFFKSATDFEEWKIHREKQRAISSFFSYGTSKLDRHDTQRVYDIIKPYIKE